MGDILAKYIENCKMLDIDTPFGKPSSEILSGKIGDNEVLFINRHGDGHRYPPSKVPYAANIFALKSAGAKTVIATGAVGSLRENIHPGQIVLVDQFIDKTFLRQSSFFDDVAAVHCEFSHPVCGRLKDCLFSAAEKLEIDIHKTGTYLCMEGPSFSTKAESIMHRQWGGDLIGMTAMPEAKLCRQAQMCYSLIAMPSDYDCWKEHDPNQPVNSLLEEIIGNLNRASQNATELILTALKNGNSFCDNDCFCRKALDCALWTDKSVIDQNKMKLLQPLFD